MKQIEISYSELRTYSDKVITIIGSICGENNLSLATRIEGDIRITGDDIGELLLEFQDKFLINFDGFNFEEYFHEEATPITQIPFLLLLIPVYLLGLTLNLIFNLFRSHKLDKLNEIISPVERIRKLIGVNKKDLTVGDFVTWVINKEFITRDDVHFKLK